jgi:hypothetical protein
MQDGPMRSDTVRPRASLALLVFGSFLVLSFLVLSAIPAAGQDGEVISRYDVEIEIVRDGTIEVREAITYDFGGNQRHGIFRNVPERVRYDDKYDRLFQIEVVSVSASAGTPARYHVERDDGIVQIRIGDPIAPSREHIRTSSRTASPARSTPCQITTSSRGTRSGMSGLCPSCWRPCPSRRPVRSPDSRASLVPWAPCCHAIRPKMAKMRDSR